MSIVNWQCCKTQIYLQFPPTTTTLTYPSCSKTLQMTSWVFYPDIVNYGVRLLIYLSETVCVRQIDTKSLPPALSVNFKCCQLFIYFWSATFHQFRLDFLTVFWCGITGAANGAEMMIAKPSCWQGQTNSSISDIIYLSVS